MSIRNAGNSIYIDEPKEIDAIKKEGLKHNQKIYCVTTGQKWHYFRSDWPYTSMGYFIEDNKKRKRIKQGGDINANR